MGKKITVLKKNVFMKNPTRKNLAKSKDFGHEESVGFALSPGANVLPCPGSVVTICMLFEDNVMIKVSKNRV